MDQEDRLERAKNEFVNRVAHEVRTPLAIIKESLALVLEEIPGKLNPDQKKLLINAKENSDRLIQSLEKILSNSWDKKGEL